MKMISWNIQRGRGLHDTCSIERAVADLRRIADFDVLCLQEVSAGYTDLPGSDGANQFIGLSRLLPGYTPVAGVCTDALGEGGARLLFGNMIFSRFPVLQVLRHSLPWPPDPQVMSMARGALEVTLDTPLGLVRVSTAHLEYFSPLQRAAQIVRLRELHRDAGLQAQAARPGYPEHGPFCAIPRASLALLAGDFNFLPDSSDYERITAPFEEGIAPLRDAWTVTHPYQPHEPTVCLRAEDTRPFTFDYVFASADLAPRLRGMRVASEIAGPDHQPVLVKLG